MFASTRLMTRTGGKNVAVVLSGCGVYDGTEITEAVSVLVALSRAGVTVQCFAPDREQAHVIDHTKGEPTGEKRNVLIESSRIARGNIKPLNELSSSNFDAVIIPGGFGAAKNFCNFAFEGEKFSVKEDVENMLKDFRNADKPIALCCISPVIAAKVFPGCSVTIGNDSGTASAIESVGSKNEERKVTEVCVDEKNKIVTSPAYMYGDAAPHEIFDGIQNMITETLKLIKE